MLVTKSNSEKQERLDTSSIRDIQLISKSEYRAKLREHLPLKCFEPDFGHVFHYMFFMIVYCAGIYGLACFDFALPVKILISIIMGVSLGALTFFLHDLLHSSIIKSKPVMYLFGLSVGLFNLFAPSFWQKVHNLHHARTGNIDDPDRSYLKDEGPSNPVEKVVYKTRISNESYNPVLSLIFMSTGFFWYFLNTMFYGLVGRKASIKEDKKYQRIQELFKSNKSRLFVLSELIIIFSFQAVLFVLAADKNLFNFFLISALPIAISHFIAMSYIHTNHFVSPFTGEIDDPLVNSLSIKDSWIVDKIFSNFSHHVEHHIFPAMGSRHYPKVRKLLLKFYPERFQLLTMLDAMKLLFNTPRIYNDYTSLITTDGKKIDCLLPKA